MGQFKGQHGRGQKALCGTERDSMEEGRRLYVGPERDSMEALLF